jgi:hypothetical protein
VQNVLRNDWEDEGLRQDSAATSKLRNHLTQEYHIPSWFWKKRGWDANGFFASIEDPVRDAEVEGSHCE